MRLSPDQLIFWQYGWFHLNATIVFTWAIMLFMGIGAMLITRRLSTNQQRSRRRPVRYQPLSHLRYACL